MVVWQKVVGADNNMGEHTGSPLQEKTSLKAGSTLRDTKERLGTVPLFCHGSLPAKNSILPFESTRRRLFPLGRRGSLPLQFP